MTGEKPTVISDPVGTTKQIRFRHLPLLQDDQADKQSFRELALRNIRVVVIRDGFDLNVMVLAAQSPRDEINAAVVHLRREDQEAVHRELHLREVLSEGALLEFIQPRPLIPRTPSRER